MARSARLDGRMYISLRDDQTATAQSIVVLALAGLSFGIGLTVSIGADLFGLLVGSLAGVAAGMFVGFVWLSLTYIFGTRVFKGSSGYWGLARPFFFAASPGLVFLFMAVPVPPVPDLARAIGVTWIAVSVVFAVKNCLGFDALRSLLTFIVVAFVLLVSYGAFISLFG